MSTRDQSTTSNDSPHRSSAEFYAYYAARHDSPELVMRFQSLKDKVLAFLAQRPDNQTRSVLDVGCGPGTQALLWAADGYQVAALDINGPLVERARERATEQGLTIDFQLGSATALPWPDQCVDICLVPELLEHVADWRTVLNEAVRVLKPGGLLFLSTTSSLCPYQEEFNLPCYAWYPGWLKRRYERLAVTTRPEIANFATYPAVNWFTPYSLGRELAARGVVAHDRFDTLDIGTNSLAKKIIARLCRAVPPLRFIGHCFTPSTVLIGIRSS